MKDVNIKLQLSKEDFKKKLDVRDGHTPSEEELKSLIIPLIPEPIKGGRGDKGVKGDKGDSGIDGKNGKTPLKNIDYFDGRDGKDAELETGESIVKKIDPLKNVLNFQILKNVPDFVLYKDLPHGNGDGGGGGGQIITFQDEGVTITQNPITKFNVVGSNASLVYSGSGVATLTIGDADTGITELTGDVTAGPGNGSQVATLATVNSNIGSFGSASQVATFTVNGKGLITATSNTPISITSGAITDFTEAAQDAVGAMVDTTLVYVDGTPLLTRAALTGDITAPQASNVTTLATVNSSVGSFGSATQSTQITANGKGLITAIANVTITPAVGSITGLGTGVTTALAVNVGTDGAFVVKGGALGTPSSGVATNITGLPAASVLAGTFGTGAYVSDTSFQAPIFKSNNADVADSGVIRLGNAELIAWEATPAGTDLTIQMDSNNVFTSSVPINATTGFRIGNVATSGKFLVGNGTNYIASTSTIPTSAGATANKLLLSDGTNYVLSTPTFPNASATTRKIIVSDGTNWIASTETYAVPGTSGNVLRSDGTNWTSATSAAKADALTTARTIGGVSFDGSANIVPQTIQSINEATDTTCFPLFISASGAQSLQPLNNTSLTFNSNTGALGATSFVGTGTSLTGIPYTLTGTANQVVLSAGTGNITFSLPQSIATSSTPQFARLGLNQAADGTASLAFTQDGLGTSSTDGIIAQNTTASASQYSPRVRFRGRSANNNTTDWIIESRPQSGGNDSEFWFAADSGGAGYTSIFGCKYNGASGNPQFNMNAPAAHNFNLSFQAGGAAKWYLRNRGDLTDQFTFMNSDASGNVEKFILTQAGALQLPNYGTGIAMFDASGNITSVNTTLTASNYTPTATNVTNITSSTPNNATYSRLGNIVTVFGTITVTETLAVASQVDVSLPIASNLGAATDLNGIASMDSTASVNLYIKGDATNDRASIFFTAAGVGQTSVIYYSYQYKVI